MSKFSEYIKAWKEQDKALIKEASVLKEDVWQVLPKVTKKLKSIGAKEVIIFGSFIEGDFMPNSDIDIAVEGLSSDKYIDAIIETEKILRSIPIDFDLILSERAYSWIKEKIEKGTRL